jgi:hypothetical protein
MFAAIVTIILFRLYFLHYGSLSPFLSSAQDKSKNVVIHLMPVSTGMLELKEALDFTFSDYFGNVFIDFRNSEVAIGMCQFVIASTTSYWYFSHLKGK